LTSVDVAPDHRLAEVVAEAIRWVEGRRISAERACDGREREAMAMQREAGRFKCRGSDGREYTVIRFEQRDVASQTWEPGPLRTTTGILVYEMADGPHQLGDTGITLDCSGSSP